MVKKIVFGGNHAELTEAAIGGIHESGAVHVAAVVAADDVGRGGEVLAAGDLEWAVEVKEAKAKKFESFVPEGGLAAGRLAQVSVVGFEGGLVQQFAKGGHGYLPN